MLPIAANPRHLTERARSPLLPAAVVVGVVGALALFSESEGLRNFGMMLLCVVTGLLSLVLDIRVGFISLLVAISISPDIEMWGMELRLEDFIIPFLGIAWAVRHMARREEMRPTVVGRAYAVLFGVSLFSAVMAWFMATQKMSFGTSMFHILKIVEYFLILFLVVNVIRDLRDVKLFIAFLFLASFLLFIFGYFQIGGAYTESIGPTGGRLSGPKGETSNILGGYFVFHMVIALAMVWTIEQSRYRTLLVLYLLIAVYPFLKTLSRSSYVSLMGTLVICALLLKRGFWKFLMAMVVAGIVFSILAEGSPILERASTIFSFQQESSWQARTFAWKAAMRKFWTSPAFGTGPGSVALGDVDNEYVKTIVEIGIIGMGVFLYIVWRFLGTALATWRLTREKDSVLAGFSMGVFLGIAGLLIHGVAATSWTTIRTMEPFYFAAGLLVSIFLHYQHQTEREKTSHADPYWFWNGNSRGRERAAPHPDRRRRRRRVEPEQAPAPVMETI
ncbi:MAG: O-antigen ligase family protein [Planctomycetes bacterium]|nr:O-antigen ligase family protein [Planctomycetota bacterium]